MNLIYLRLAASGNITVSTPVVGDAAADDSDYHDEDDEDEDKLEEAEGGDADDGGDVDGDAKCHENTIESTRSTMPSPSLLSSALRSP